MQTQSVQSHASPKTGRHAPLKETQVWQAQGDSGRNGEPLVDPVIESTESKPKQRSRTERTARKRTAASQSGDPGVPESPSPEPHPPALPSPPVASRSPVSLPPFLDPRMASPRLPESEQPAPTPPQPIGSLEPDSDQNKQVLTQELARLEAQVQHINELSSDLEAAMLGLNLIAAKISQQQQSLQLTKASEDAEPVPPVSNLAVYATVSLPYIQKEPGGAYRVRMRRIDRRRSERPAGQPSQPSPQSTTLPSNLAPGSGVTGTELPSSGVSSRPLRSSRSRWQWLRVAMSIPDHAIVMAMDALLWIGTAATMRLGLQLLLSVYPILWGPVMLLLLISVGIAVRQVIVMAQAGVILGYRLLLILIGLLIGGQL